MSDNYLRFVPSDPRFRPTEAAVLDARQLLSSFLPQAEYVTAEFFENPQFIDPGANWSGVLCPSCGKDAEEWWNEAMSKAAEQQFSKLDVIAPCCGVMVSLNDLRYVWPAAFGSFVIDAMNPNTAALTAEQLKDLERTLGCSIREVAQHL